MALDLLLREAGGFMKKQTFIFLGILSAVLSNLTAQAGQDQQQTTYVAVPHYAVMKTDLNQPLSMENKTTPTTFINTFRDSEQGDGISDNTPETGIPVSWMDGSDDNFAFISKRAGVENVYLNIHGEEIAVTHNTSSARTYDHLASRPHFPLLAFDEDTFYGLFATVRTEMTLGLGVDRYFSNDLRDQTTSFVWNADGTKSAYALQRFDGGTRRLEIHVVDYTPSTPIEHVTRLRNYPGSELGRLSFWGDTIVFAETLFGGTLLYADDSGAPVEIYLPPVYDVDPFRNSDPAVSPTESLIAYTETLASGRKAVAICRLSTFMATDGTHRYRCDGHRRLTPTSTDPSLSPTWSSDGHWIYFVGNSKIHRIHPDGTGEEQITEGEGEDASPVPFGPFSN